MLGEPIQQILERCGSTNDEVRQLGLEGAAHGSWVSTRVQETGRGRLGREWRSLEGNLFLSVLLRPQVEAAEVGRSSTDRTYWTWVPLVIACATMRGLSNEFPALPLRIKWPNDLWLGSAKIGGILCEGVSTSQAPFIVAGIGLNCAEAPEALDQPTAALQEALARFGVDPAQAAVDRLRPMVAAWIVEAINHLFAEGPAETLAIYEAMAALRTSTVISWRDNDAAIYEGAVIGLGPYGELKVRMADGSERALYAEDVKILKTGG